MRWLWILLLAPAIVFAGVGSIEHDQGRTWNERSNKTENIEYVINNCSKEDLEQIKIDCKNNETIQKLATTKLAKIAIQENTPNVDLSI